MKKVIRLTESDLHRIIKESVKKVIKEWGDCVPDSSDYLNDEPGNRWYREHPDYMTHPEYYDDENYNEDEYEFIDDDQSAWNEDWK